MAIYYVDTAAAAGGDGTTSALTGAHCAWDTIADVNAASFSAGDSVLFARGCIWRETLTVPSGGSAGSRITFGAYGTGADPIISGADVATSGWSAAPGSLLAADGNTKALWRFNSDLTDASGSGLTLTTQASSPTFVDDPYEKGVQGDGTWYATNADGGGVLNWSTNTSWTLEVVFRYIGTSGAVTGMVAKGQDNARWGLFRYSNGIMWFCQDTAAGSFNASAGSYNDNTWRHAGMIVDRTAKTLKCYVNGSQIGSTIDITTMVSLDTAVAVVVAALKSNGNTPAVSTTQIAEIRISNIARDPTTFPTSISGPPTNVWQKTVSTQTRVVLFNWTLGTLKANAAAITTSNQWTWASNLLYVYSVGDPATSYSAPGIQYSQRDHAIYATAKDNITIDGIEAQCGNALAQGTITLDLTSGGSGTGQIIRNCTIWAGAADGVLLAAFPNPTTLTDSIVEQNVISDIGRYAVNAFQTNATVGHELQISDNVITRASFSGIVYRGNYGIITRNIIADVGNLAGIGGGIHIYSGSLGEGTGDNCVISFNLITNCIGHLYDGFGIAIDQFCDNAAVFYNIVNGSDGPAFYFFDAASGAFYNNTGYNACRDTAGDGLERGGIRLTSSASPNNLTANARVKNNICYVSAAGAVAVYVDDDTVLNAATLNITNNSWYRSSGNWYSWNGTPGATLATWNALTGVGTDLNSDPLLVNAAGGDFRLQSNSPCRDAGVDVGLTSDILGRLLQGLPDIGAYEFQPVLSGSGALRSMMGLGMGL